MGLQTAKRFNKINELLVIAVMVNLAWCNFPHSPIIDIICQNYALKRSKYQMFPTMVKHKEVYSIVQLYRCVFIKSLVAITSGRVREWGGRLCMRQNVTWIKLVIFNPKSLKNRLWHRSSPVFCSGLPAAPAGASAQIPPHTAQAGPAGGGVRSHASPVIVFSR